MTGHHLPHRQNQSLGRMVLRSVRRMLEDVHAFEMRPHGVRRVGEPAGSKRIRRQQIAELIGDDRLADRQHRQEKRPGRKGGRACEENRHRRRRASRTNARDTDFETAMLRRANASRTRITRASSSIA